MSQYFLNNFLKEMKTRLTKKLRKLAKKNIYIVDCPNEVHRYKLVCKTNMG